MTIALVIDDNKQTTEALVQMLKIWDIAARPAYGPSAALKILSEATPNIVFLDINMPVLSGWDVLSKFTNFPDEIKNQFTIYILSSSVAVEDKEKADKCPLVAGFVEKPLTAELLQDLFFS